MSKTYIGIDNGVTGTIGMVGGTAGTGLWHMPVRTEQSYTKARQQITRVDYRALLDVLHLCGPETLILIERPMVNPGRFKATVSALRCLEAVLITVESLKVPYQYCDSKEWQREMLPKGTDKDDLKRVSLEIGKRLFPSADWKGFKDADSLLMAEWARRRGL